MARSFRCRPSYRCLARQLATIRRRRSLAVSIGGIRIQIGEKHQEVWVTVGVACLKIPTPRGFAATVVVGGGSCCPSLTGIPLSPSPREAQVLSKLSCWLGRHTWTNRVENGESYMEGPRRL